jgi:hypothetical protein
MPPITLKALPAHKTVRLCELVVPDAKKINKVKIPTSIKKTPILLSMYAMINEMAETGNDRFSHFKCDTDPGSRFEYQAENNYAPDFSLLNSGGFDLMKVETHARQHWRYPVVGWYN